MVIKIKRLQLVVVLVGAIFITSCAGKKDVVKSQASSVSIHVPEGYVSMKVVDYSGLDGCGFLLQQNDSLFFEPLHLDSNMRMNDLKVFVQYKLAKNQMGICMRGKKIEILDIKVQGK